MTDTYCHTLNPGEKYFQGKFYQMCDKGSQVISGIVISDEVFKAFIEFDDLVIDKNEYLYLTEQSWI